jgi:hypothetical protein
MWTLPFSFRCCESLHVTAKCRNEKKKCIWENILEGECDLGERNGVVVAKCTDSFVDIAPH